MRRLRILGGILTLAAVVFPASAVPRATVLSNVFKLPLPAAKTGAVYEVDVKLGLPAGVNITGTSGVPFSMSATNDSALPSYIRIAAKVLPGSTPSTFRMLVAINAPKGKVQRRLAGDSTADLQLNSFPPYTSVTATPRPGDKCGDLKQDAGKGTDIVGRGGSPAEGKTIETFTVDADPNCKKGGGTTTTTQTPPKTTTTTTTKNGPCEATPLPKECRFDLDVTVSGPSTLRYKVGEPVTFHLDVTVTNIGTATSDPASMATSFTFGSADHSAVVVPLAGCSNIFTNVVNCPVQPLQHGGVKHFRFAVHFTARHELDPAFDGGGVFVRVGHRSDKVSDPQCDGNNEVTCMNNGQSSQITLSKVG